MFVEFHYLLLSVLNIKVEPKFVIGLHARMHNMTPFDACHCKDMLPSDVKYASIVKCNVPSLAEKFLFSFLENKEAGVTFCEAKCNLGKVNLEPMRSAVFPLFSIRDLRGDLGERVVPRDLLCSGSLYMLIFADQ